MTITSNMTQPMNPDPDAAAGGVENAWISWLLAFPVTAGDLIESAINSAVKTWLDAHSEQIVAAVAAATQPGADGTQR